MSRPEEHAIEACREYEHWASEVGRLTGEIRECGCPLETPPQWPSAPATDSCFSKASEKECPGRQPDDGPQRLNLDGIQKEVESCESCVHLCNLIRQRKHARQRYGVAKRRVRSVGKKLLASAGGGKR